jgi:hypothetical protein
VVDGCGAPDQSAPIPAGVDLERETVIRGVVSRDGESGLEPVPGAYVRLLDGSGEFVAEVVTPATGDFRFFAAPGRWTLSVQHRLGAVRQEVAPQRPGLFEASVLLG